MQQLQLVAVKLETSKADSGVKLRIVGYSGGVVEHADVAMPFVISLSGIQATNPLPILEDHENSVDTVVGQGVATVGADGFVVDAKTTVATEAGQRVTKLVKEDDFKFQASLGISWDGDVHMLSAGESETVNGQKLTAGSRGLLVVDKSKVDEVSVVVLGADSETSVSIAARKTMPDTKSEIELALKAQREELVKINLTCDKLEFTNPEIKTRVVDLKAKALNGEISIMELKDQLLEASQADVRLSRKMNEMPGGGFNPGIHSVDNTPHQDVMECAIQLRLKTPGTEKQFKPEVLDAASSRRWRRLGLKESLFLAAQARGWAGSMTDVQGALHACSVRMASSTISLPGIFSNIANKEIQAGFVDQGDNIWREFSQVKTNSDYKVHTSYRMTDDLEYQELGPNGEITHGDLGEESMERRVKFYAKMVAFTIEQFVNDDLQALSDVRARLGRGSNRKLNKLWWATFLTGKHNAVGNMPALFPTDGSLNNLLTGSTTTLLTDGVGLELGVKKFRKMRTPDDKRIDGSAVKLLVPPELEFIADRLVAPIAAASVASVNPHAGKYQVFVHDYLSDTSFDSVNASAIEWGLFRDPAILAPMIVSFLDGVETPVVEESAAAFNTFGLELRGSHSFGVDLGDGLAGVWSKAAA